MREKADYQHEYPLVLPDGTQRNVRTLSQPVLDASGKLVEFIGTVVDSHGAETGRGGAAAKK